MRVTMKRRLEAHEGWMIAAPERDLPANMRAWFMAHVSTQDELDWLRARLVATNWRGCAVCLRARDAAIELLVLVPILRKGRALAASLVRAYEGDRICVQ
jgi:hypothetical protein